MRLFQKSFIIQIQKERQDIENKTRAIVWDGKLGVLFEFH